MVFDLVTVTAASNTFVLSSAKTADVTDPACGTACNSLKINPGSTLSVDWTLNTFSGFDAGETLWAPYNIELTFGDIADSAASHVYENWIWVAVCTNI